jgi:hypothetical protein
LESSASSRLTMSSRRPWPGSRTAQPGSGQRWGSRHPPRPTPQSGPRSGWGCGSGSPTCSQSLC